MENLTLVERLDALLEFIVIEKDNHGIVDFYTDNYKRGIELSDKLERDGYIKRVTKTSSGLTQVDNTATIEGRIFYSLGGYKQHFKNNKIKLLNLRLQALAVIGGGIFAALYYSLEILKSYAMPLFQYYCHCHFVWQTISK